MRFSFILPVKNGGDYVKQCVQSILAQTVKDFNLIILENKSTDGTAEWLQALSDKRVIVIPSETSLSIEENWARILSVSKNEFITITGHDDLFDANYLQVMTDLIAHYPDASLYQTQFTFIDAKGNFLRRCKPMPEKQNVAEFLHLLLADSIDTMGSGYMMRSKDYNSVGGIPSYPNLLFADHALWIKLTALSYKATSLKESFFYRLHESVSKGSSAAPYISSFYDFMNFLLKLSADNLQIKETITKDISPYILYYCRSLSHRLLKTSVDQRNGMTVTGFINDCIKYNKMLSSKQDFQPLKQFNIRLAKAIDDNLFLRNSYLLFKKFYTKPVYS